jgi:hypothetical protein
VECASTGRKIAIDLLQKGGKSLTTVDGWRIPKEGEERSGKSGEVSKSRKTLGKRRGQTFPDGAKLPRLFQTDLGKSGEIQPQH